ncbi:hypothetical protein ACU8KH_00986 [Lachancea thermotolerans]
MTISDKNQEYLVIALLKCAEPPSPQTILLQSLGDFKFKQIQQFLRKVSKWSICKLDSTLLNIEKRVI